MFAKWAKFREIVGKVEEKEPEGEAVAGPSGEATVHSYGITPSILSFSLLLIYVYLYIFVFFFNTSHISLLSFTLFFLADESTDEEISKPNTKEEEDIDTLHSWVQGGGSCSSGGGAMGTSVGSEFISSLSLFLPMWLSTSLHSYPCIFFIF